jgi:RNA polymerase sigma factor (sigma-70 family)
MPRQAVRLASVLRIAAGPSADVDLVGRYLQGDPAALEAMVRRHGPAVLGVCRRMLGSGADADDAFQATFLTLTLRARSIRKPAALGSWLHGVAVRCCRKALGRRARPPAGDVAGRSDPFAEVAWRELRGLLDEELNRLPATLRAPLILCLIESRARDEAARSLGWSLRTFDRRLARGRAALKARLVRRGVGTLGLGLGVLNAEGLTAGVPERLVGAVCGTRAVVPPAVRALVAPAANGFRFKLALGVVLTLGSLAAVSGFGGTPPAEKPPDRPAPKVEPAEDLEDPMPVGALRRFGSTRFRYPSSFAHAALSPDGKRVAIGGYANVLIYDTETGKRVRVLDNFWPTDGAGRHPAMAFSPDGKFLAHLVRWGEVTARVCDVETGKEVAAVKGLRPDLLFLTTSYSPPRKTEGVDGNFTGLYFTDAGRRIILVGERYVHVRDARTGAPVAKYDLPTSQTKAGGAIRQETIVCFSPDGRLYAVVAGDNWQVREPATGKVLFRATVKPAVGKDGRPAGQFAAISADGKTVAILAGALDEVQLWDIPGGRLLRTLTVRATKVRMLGQPAFSADGKQVFAGGEDFVFRWDAGTGTELPALAGDTGRGPPRAFASTDGQTLVTVDGNGLIRRWDPTTGKPLAVPNGYTTQTITDLSADGAYAVVADDAGRIDLWTVGENSRHELNPIGTSSARDVRFSRDGKLLAAGLSDGTVRVWDVQMRKEIKTFRADPNGEPSAVRSVEWSADGSCLYTTTRPSGLLAWDWREGRLRWQMPAADATRVRASRDGKRVAVVRCDQREVLILDARTGTVQTTLEMNRHLEVECVAFSPDGRTVVTGLHAGGVYIWDAATGKYLGWFPSQGQGDVIWGIEFSGDGRHVVTASSLGPVRVWELDTKTEVFRRTDWQSSSLRVSLSADGRKVLAAQQRAPILWSLAAEPTGDRDRQWADLLTDPVTAYRAQWGLAGSDGLARFLRAKIGDKVPESDAERIARLIAELDAGSFRTRETALAELVRLGRVAEPAVRTALAGSPPAEQRQRLESLAARYKDGLPPDELRTRRAVQALRWCGDAEAKKLLTEWASGMDGAPLTEATRAALEAME